MASGGNDASSRIFRRSGHPARQHRGWLVLLALSLLVECRMWQLSWVLSRLGCAFCHMAGQPLPPVVYTTGLADTPRIRLDISMHIRYHLIHLRFADESPAASHCRHSAAHGNIPNEDVCVVEPGESPRIPLGSVSTAVFAGRDILEQLDVPCLFDLLAAMRHLRELTIEFDEVEPVPHWVELPALPFRLRRLALNVIFPDAFDLIESSCDTLEHLALGPPCDMHRSTANMLGDLSDLSNLRALRIDTAPDGLALPAMQRLTELAIRGHPSSALGVRNQLTRLTIICHRFNDDVALALVEVLPAFVALRALEIEMDFGNDFTLARGAGKLALAGACRARQIGVSVLRTRNPGEW